MYAYLCVLNRYILPKEMSSCVVFVKSSFMQSSWQTSSSQQCSAFSK